MNVFLIERLLLAVGSIFVERLPVVRVKDEDQIVRPEVADEPIDRPGRIPIHPFNARRKVVAK